MNWLPHNRGFLIHLIVYVAVSLLLVSINILTAPSKLWFYLPLAGWGVGIIAHALWHRPRANDGAA